MKHFIYLSILLFLWLLVSAGNANAQLSCGDIPIDDFSESLLVAPIVTTTNEPLIEFVDDGGDGVIGRFRSITHEALEGPGLSALLFIGAGELNIANAADVISRNSLLYDANGSGLNLNLAGRELVRVTVLTLDNGINITFVLTDENSNQATQTQSIPGGVSSATGPLDVEFLFDDFTGIQGIDLSAIESVELVLQSDTISADVRIGETGFGCRGTPESVAVPTMGAQAYAVMALMLLLLGIFALRRANG